MNGSTERAIRRGLKKTKRAVRRMDVIDNVDDPRHGGDRLKTLKTFSSRTRCFEAGYEGEAAKPFIGLLEGDARNVGDAQVLLQCAQKKCSFMENRQR